MCLRAPKPSFLVVTCNMQRCIHWVATLGSLVSLSYANSCSWLTSSNDNTTTPAAGYSPCSSSSAVTCCGNTDACLSNGYCSGSFGLYRGACTDWSAGVCPETCAYSSFVSEGETYYLANIYRCNGQGKGEIWWCGDQSADTTSQPCQSGFGSTFSMTSIGTFLTPVPLVAAATANSAQTTSASALYTSSATSMSSSASATSGASFSTPSGTSSKSSSVPLGVGLGVGLGVPLLAAIGALIYLLARKRRGPPVNNATPQKQEMLQPALPQGAPPYQQKPELHGTQLNEIPGVQQQSTMAELGAGSYRGTEYSG